MIDRSGKEFHVDGGTGPGEIADLTATFLEPGGGAFGRDKKVSIDDAVSANVSYTKDGVRVNDQIVDVVQAVALVERAQADGDAALKRRTDALAAQRARAAAELEEARRKVANLACTVCDGRSFDEQISREDSQMGFTTFRMKLLICRRCGFVMHFSLGQSLFVPG
jgi:hypothetical protein